MNRDALATVLVGLLAVLALGGAAASLESPTNVGDAGSGGGSVGPGEGSTFDLGRPSPIDDPLDGPTLPRVLVRLLVALLVVGFLLGVYVLRDELSLRDLRTVAVASVLFGVFLAMLYLLLTLGGSGETGAGGLLGERAPTLPGGGDGSLGDGARTLATDPPLLAFVLAAVLLVGAAVVLRSDGADAASESTPVEPDVGVAGIGRVAGRAADRIADDSAVHNEVYRAWREMTAHLDVANPASSTPREFADAAVDAGMAREDVEELTDLFRLARYGGQSVTADHETRALAALRRIEREYGEEP